MSATNTLEKQRCYVMDETMGKPYCLNIDVIVSGCPPSSLLLLLSSLCTEHFVPPKKV